MYQTNPTEIFRERQIALLREAEERRIARQLRQARSQKSSRLQRGRLGEEFRRVFATWGRTSVPFFRA